MSLRRFILRFIRQCSFCRAQRKITFTHWSLTPSGGLLTEQQKRRSMILVMSASHVFNHPPVVRVTRTTNRPYLVAQ